MNLPIHMDDLGDFVAVLRIDGFDAREDLFNGQVGLIVGPRGLDTKRMPPNTAALFFPLWELNYTGNRMLVETRHFHDIFESRPSDWRVDRPYPNQVEQERINLRHWNRSASLLGDRNLQDTIQQALIRRFPANSYPLNIDVSGGQSQTYATVRLTNFDVGIDESEKAIPENFLDSGGMFSAVFDAVERLIGALEKSGRLHSIPTRAQYANVNLSLKPIADVGDGPDVRNWKEAIQYEVQGLPPAERAWIANFGAPNRQNWRILRATEGVQSDWTGDYGSAEEALVSFQKQFTGTA
jgi:hypothetical protein